MNLPFKIYIVVMRSFLKKEKQQKAVQFKESSLVG
jgi:hypothetical protein